MNMGALTGADDLPHRPLTVKDVERMSDAGILRAEDRVELIGGQLIAMHPKGTPHEALKLVLLRHWHGAMQPDGDLIPHTTFRLSEDTFIEPDFLVFPRTVGVSGLSPATVLLAVELSDSSLGYDLGPKALVYAHFGVRELWVIDAVGMRIHVHRDPEAGRYRSITPWSADDLVVPAFAPSDFALRLGDLDLTD